MAHQLSLFEPEDIPIQQPLAQGLHTITPDEWETITPGPTAKLCRVADPDCEACQ